MTDSCHIYFVILFFILENEYNFSRAAAVRAAKSSMYGGVRDTNQTLRKEAK
jgi:hypothetical protein